MFVARVRGGSLEPRVPDGAYCLFRATPLPPPLVRQGGAVDPETGGQYTVKLYREETTKGGERRVVLRPINTDFVDLVLTQASGGGVRVIAEVVEVLGT